MFSQTWIASLSQGIEYFRIILKLSSGTPTGSEMIFSLFLKNCNFSIVLLCKKKIIFAITNK
ncbi:hypothetical protein DAPPUDRAFT_302512 [Daphnia pulex]|uniref:Uncharacterized protein n=1 Tax=Daphnia pulex TaxID=6669 RepID=E9GDH3_DAPPU|nr:hypothetical protein DAPPUDRAFT_302512 [Daphnia pulex]|eukprot:EFX82477.1 hypothetical protein DAPPUDRAFT_302512 [Daphnia pulex]